jgi:hypothetical protein
MRCSRAPSGPRISSRLAERHAAQTDVLGKATAVHVCCKRGTQGDRYSRHWHDLVRLDDAGHADAAFADPALAKDVAEFKGKFFRTKDSAGNQIDYVAAVSGHLQLVPDAATLKMLEADYKKMADDGILLDDAEPFAASARTPESERSAVMRRLQDQPNRIACAYGLRT